MNEVVSVSGLGKAYGGTQVLRDVSFGLGPGERLAVLGSSGSGKTTLLRLIAGLEAPTEGEVKIAGKVGSRPGEMVIRPEHREVALVFQGLALFPHLAALDQIAFAARGRGGVPEARHLLERVGLKDRARARLDELSGGERQRVALARALAQRPKILLMDEPFASLDDEKRAEMRDLLRSLLDTTETALILVSHSRDDAFDLARRVLVLESGRPVAQDLIERALCHPEHSAAVRALGLGRVVLAEVLEGGEVRTVFGQVRLARAAKPGQIQVLIRPGQARIAANGEGVEAEVIAMELRPPEMRDIQRYAIVRLAEATLRVVLHDEAVTAGQRVRIRIEGECDALRS